MPAGLSDASCVELQPHLGASRAAEAVRHIKRELGYGDDETAPAIVDAMIWGTARRIAYEKEPQQIRISVPRDSWLCGCQYGRELRARAGCVCLAAYMGLTFSLDGPTEVRRGGASAVGAEVPQGLALRVREEVLSARAAARSAAEAERALLPLTPTAPGSRVAETGEALRRERELLASELFGRGRQYLIVRRSDAIAARSDAIAARLFRAAGSLGHAEAQFALGQLYAGGRGVERDDVEAAFWWGLAAQQGHVEAQAALDRIGPG